MQKILLKIGLKVTALIMAVLGIFIVSDAVAKVGFLPGNGSGNSRVSASVGNTCSGYALSKPKCENEACKAGWNCSSCSNAKGKYYKCTPKDTPAGYTVGLQKCPKTCQEYSYKGFTGNKINGRCVDISNCSPTALSEDARDFEYHYGVSINGNQITYLNRTGYKN